MNSLHRSSRCIFIILFMTRRLVTKISSDYSAHLQCQCRPCITKAHVILQHFNTHTHMYLPRYCYCCCHLACTCGLIISVTIRAVLKWLYNICHAYFRVLGVKVHWAKNNWASAFKWHGLCCTPCLWMIMLLLLLLLLMFVITTVSVEFFVVQTLLSLSKLSALAVPERSDDLNANIDGMYQVFNNDCTPLHSRNQ